MSFDQRSYSGKVFRPTPELSIQEDGSFGVIATPWGPRDGAKKAVELLTDYVLSARQDMEATSPFQKLTCLSPLANSLRAGLMMANDTLYREENKAEYTTGCEILVFAHAEGELNIFNWGNYTSPEMIKKFEDKFKVKVTITDYDSNDTALAKVRQGGHGFDIVVPSASVMPIWISEGLLLQSEPNQLENFKNVDEQWVKVPFDEGRHYSVPWLWGTTGVTVNAVLPGPTRSEILGDFMAKQAEAQGITQDEAERGFLTEMRPTGLLGRFATTDEVANMIVYACSEQASATSGAALRVDGGVVRFVG